MDESLTKLKQIADNLLIGEFHRHVLLCVGDACCAAVGKEVVDSYYADESEKVLAPVSKFLLRHGINAKSSWKVGSAGALIAKLADEGKFDLVVMGSHGHGAWANLVMGSVATQVLAQCGVPVLMVR